MGYKRFGYVGKDYEVGHLRFLLIPIYLLSFSVGFPYGKGMNDEKETEYFKTQHLILRFTTIS